MIASKVGDRVVGQYCPHQSHDRSGIPAFYKYDGVTPRKKEGL